jgi:two-component system nitrogen regulation response regulator NtrX
MKQILIIEDEESIREYICFILNNHGFKTVEAKNGDEGLKRFREQSFDLIMTDMVMPDKDGKEIMEIIRKTDPNVAVMAISGAMSYKELLSGAGKVGADAVVQKPFTENELVKTVRACLAKSANGGPPRNIAGTDQTEG